MVHEQFDGSKCNNFTRGLQWWYAVPRWAMQLRASKIAFFIVNWERTPLRIGNNALRRSPRHELSTCRFRLWRGSMDDKNLVHFWCCILHIQAFRHHCLLLPGALLIDFRGAWKCTTTRIGNAPPSRLAMHPPGLAGRMDILGGDPKYSGWFL